MIWHWAGWTKRIVDAAVRWPWHAAVVFQPSVATSMLTVYYDHSCPICRDEIAAIRGADVEGAIRFVDCSPAGFAVNDAGAPSREALMRLLHAQADDGTWLVGAAAFARIYGLVGMPWMARLWGARLLQPLWRRVYPWIADNRRALSASPLAAPFSRLVHRAAERAAARRRCADGACTLPAGKSQD
jgi:predicted DCC family thiol-disulfide oxidoreductase YuxK